MTHGEFTHILNSLNGLTPDQIEQLRRALESKAAVSPAASQPDHDPISGMWRDDVELIDQIVEDAMRNRREQPWQLTTGQ